MRFAVFFLLAQHQRADAVGVAEGEHAVARYHGNDGIRGRATPLVHSGDRIEDVVYGQVQRAAFWLTAWRSSWANTLSSTSLSDWVFT